MHFSVYNIQFTAHYGLIGFIAMIVIILGLKLGRPAFWKMRRIYYFLRSRKIPQMIGKIPPRIAPADVFSKD